MPQGRYVASPAYGLRPVVGSPLLLSVTCFALLLLAVAPVRADDAVAVGIAAPSFVPAGETFVVELLVGAVAGLDTAQFTITYDSALVDPVAGDVAIGSGFPDNDGAVVNPGLGDAALVVVNFPGFSGVEGSGALVRLPFRTLARGSTALALSLVVLGDGGGMAIPSATAPPIFVDVGVSPDFDRRAHWVYDPSPGGNGDGIASPGESVYPRIRLKNVGTGEARGVRVHYTTQDPATDLRGSGATSDAWPAGMARNSDALTMAIASDVEPRDVTIVVDVTADNGGPWRFVVVLPIAYPAVFFQLRSAWLFDPAPGGNKDGVANPGERLQPRVRLRNVGVEDARNVRVTLSLDDPSITVLTGDAVHETWPVGEARNNIGLLLDIAPDAAPTDVHVRVYVQADNGGPWAFDISIAIVDLPAEFSLRSSWTYDPDGNGDGAASPGERVRPRIRLRNNGPGVGRNVRVALSAVDGETGVTVVAPLVRHAVWPSGEARNNEGFLVDIASDAGAGDVAAIVRVSADSGGPWTFAISIPVVVPSVQFAMRSAWAFDPAPGGNKNGVADAGERVYPRVRLRNVGADAAEVLRCALPAGDGARIK